MKIIWFLQYNWIFKTNSDVDYNLTTGAAPHIGYHGNYLNLERTSM